MRDGEGNPKDFLITVLIVIIILLIVAFNRTR